MKKITLKVFGLVFIAMVFAGCTNSKKMMEKDSYPDSAMEAEDRMVVDSPADNPEYVKVSEDDSLDALEAEINATSIDESDFTE